MKKNTYIISATTVAKDILLLNIRSSINHVKNDNLLIYIVQGLICQKIQYYENNSISHVACDIFLFIIYYQTIQHCKELKYY